MVGEAGFHSLVGIGYAVVPGHRAAARGLVYLVGSARDPFYVGDGRGETDPVESTRRATQYRTQYDSGDDHHREGGGDDSDDLLVRLDEGCRGIESLVVFYEVFRRGDGLAVLDIVDDVVLDAYAPAAMCTKLGVRRDAVLADGTLYDRFAARLVDIVAAFGAKSTLDLGSASRTYVDGRLVFRDFFGVGRLGIRRLIAGRLLLYINGTFVSQNRLFGSRNGFFLFRIVIGRGLLVRERLGLRLGLFCRHRLRLGRSFFAMRDGWVVGLDFTFGYGLGLRLVYARVRRGIDGSVYRGAVEVEIREVWRSLTG